MKCTQVSDHTLSEHYCSRLTGVQAWVFARLKRKLRRVTREREQRF